MKKKQILIVEDEVIIAMNIRNLLENLGYLVCGIASFAEEAVKLAVEKYPDLILIDIILDGDIDGIDAVNEIRQNRNIPIIYMTAHSDENTLARAKATEPHGYILKPVNFNELRSTIEIVLHKHEMEEKLKKSEEMWQFAIEGSGDGVWDWDILSRRINYSRRWKEILGYRNDDIKEDFSQWQSRIHKEDKKETIAALEENLNGKREGFCVEHRLRCKDGSYKWVLERGKVITREKDKSPLRMIGTMTDISQRKKTEEELIFMQNELIESEKRYQMIFRNMMDGYALYEIILDHKGEPADYRFLEINPAFQELTGFTGDIIGKTALEVIPDGEDFLIKTFGKVALTGECIRFEYYSAPLKKWFEISAYCPKKLQVISILIDITYQKEKKNCS